MAASSANEERVGLSPLFKKNIQEKINFSFSVFSPFTKDVRPVESGGLNVINASSTLIDSDNESINEDSPTRSDKVHEEEHIFPRLFPHFCSTSLSCWLGKEHTNRDGDLSTICMVFNYSCNYFIYCNEETMHNIERTGIVNDFSYSERSVILTTLSPTKGKEAIAKNMFGSNWRTKMKSGEVDYVICVQLPKNLLKNCSFSDRKLFKHYGKLDLNNYPWTIVKMP